MDPTQNSPVHSLSQPSFAPLWRSLSAPVSLGFDSSLFRSRPGLRRDRTRPVVVPASSPPPPLPPFTPPVLAPVPTPWFWYRRRVVRSTQYCGIHQNRKAASERLVVGPIGLAFRSLRTRRVSIRLPVCWGVTIPSNGTLLLVLVVFSGGILCCTNSSILNRSEW